MYKQRCHPHRHIRPFPQSHGGLTPRKTHRFRKLLSHHRIKRNTVLLACNRGIAGRAFQANAEDRGGVRTPSLQKTEGFGTAAPVVFRGVSPRGPAFHHPPKNGHEKARMEMVQSSRDTAPPPERLQLRSAPRHQPKLPRTDRPRTRGRANHILPVSDQ